MSLIPTSIPRADGTGRFYESPIEFLASVKSTLGNIVVIRDHGPIFSRATDCAGVVAVFGAAHHRVVLNDIETFGLPMSAGQQLSLPPVLINLNRGLHSMRAEQHTQHQRLLASVLGEQSLQSLGAAVTDGLRAFTPAWRPDQTIDLLAEMRRLALEVSTRLLLGNEYPQTSKLASALQEYFQLRREATSPWNADEQSLREDLIGHGMALDSSLRRYIRWLRRRKDSAQCGIIPQLTTIPLPSGKALSEDELIAHCNILFVSGNEPIAVALTWIFLILSQLPRLRRALRSEIDSSPPSATMQPSRTSLLDEVFKESLRLLPPNFLMARVTTQPARLGEVVLPEGCEIILCPFLAHRDPRVFPRPAHFLPTRWQEARPTPFEYFPFGAGGHYCVGHYLATSIIKTTLAWLTHHYDLVLAHDQSVDWRLHIMLMPTTAITFAIHEVRDPPVSGGKLLGPVADLINLEEYQT